MAKTQVPVIKLIATIFTGRRHKILETLPQAHEAKVKRCPFCFSTKFSWLIVKPLLYMHLYLINQQGDPASLVFSPRFHMEGFCREKKMWRDFCLESFLPRMPESCFASQDTKAAGQPASRPGTDQSNRLIFFIRM